MSTVPWPTGPLTEVYDAAYAGVPNWDISRPQRAFVWFAEAGLVRDPVLDVGCGTGELSLYLARRSHRVLGIDISAQAIRQAREKARWRGIETSLLVADAVQLPTLARAGLRFRTVVDCGMFHVLGDTERDRYVDGLATVLRPGGTVAVLGDMRRDPRNIYGISPAEVRHRFAGERWRVEFVVEAVFERRYSTSRAYFAVVSKL